ncbi:MAG: hypothetical protein WBC18_16980 [Ottowia sp.]|uniref:hypothetical protein n=1 Tax=Ottowia sp. TaxID=1898956 RepID=UPI003C737388
MAQTDGDPLRSPVYRHARYSIPQTQDLPHPNTCRGCANASPVPVCRPQPHHKAIPAGTGRGAHHADAPWRGSATATPSASG